jgi:putative membrane protein
MTMTSGRYCQARRGIGYHIALMIGLRKERDVMKAAGLVHAESAYLPSMTLIVVILLLGIGIFAIISMIAGLGPLG